MTDNVLGLTILIPTYNRAGVLRQTLDALTGVDRTGVDYEIVIIDNNSNDNTREMVREYEKQLPLFYLREHATSVKASRLYTWPGTDKVARVA